MSNQFLDKYRVISEILQFGEDHEMKVTSLKFAERINKMQTDDAELVKRGKVRREFKGLKISMGRCNQCNARLIWYTEAPPRGCSRCLARFTRGVTEGAGND